VLGRGVIGSGLGMAITLSFAILIGARISLMENPDGTQGLRARVVFPAC
jgi:signal transduction histidine kinase